MSAWSGEIHLLRYIPRETPVHRLWAGTKLLSLAALSTSLTARPTWQGEAVVIAFLALVVVVARIPAGAFPRPPWWLWGALAAGALLALPTGGDPRIALPGVTLALGGVVIWARFLLLIVLLLLGAAVLGWTTPLAEVGPALARLLAPLRRLRLPVDEMVAVLSLAVRCLPLLAGEVRILAAARRVRRPVQPTGLRARAAELQDLLATLLTTAVRRAQQMGDALEARGGTAPPSSAPVHLRARDLIALTLTAAAVAAIILL